MNALKILVVEDSLALLATLEDILTGENYSVTTARDFSSAVREFATVKPDIILLDVNLPDGNGLTLTTQIKDQQQYKKWLPVVLMSSDATVEDQLAGYKAGCDIYICKPFDPNILLAKLEVIQRLLQLIK